LITFLSPSCWAKAAPLGATRWDICDSVLEQSATQNDERKESLLGFSRHRLAASSPIKREF